MTRRRCRNVALGILLLGLLWGAVGCRGSAEFRHGLELEAEGELRPAYLQLYEAWQLSGRDDHQEALDRVGGAVAAGLVVEGRHAEDALDWSRARERFALALEYAARSASARDGLRRAIDEISKWSDTVLELEFSPNENDAWRRLERRLEAAALPACPVERRVELVRVATAALDVRVDELADATFVATLGLDGSRARRLARESRELERRLDRWLEWEETARLLRAPSSVGDDPGIGTIVAGESHGAFRDALVAGEFRESLERHRARALSAGDHLSRVLHGVALHDEARRLEKEGDLLAAYEHYVEVRLFHAGGVEARVAAARVLDAWRSETYETAQASMARGEWSDAIGRLELIEKRSPAFRDTAERLEFSRQELARENRRAAADFEARELPANALLRYLEARRAMPNDASIARAIARLEMVLERRVRPRWVIEHGARDEDDELLRRMLWNADKDAVRRLRASIDSSFALESSSSSDTDRDELGSSVRVVVEDLDFSFFEKTSTSAIERGRVLRAFSLTANPDHSRSHRELDAARESLLESQKLFNEAPAYAKSMQRDLVELARGELDQALFKTLSYAQQVPIVSWEERAYSVKNVAFVAELSALFRADRIGVDGAWVTARWEMTDRVIDDDGTVGLDLDPFELPPREQVLQRLSAELGRKLRRAVENVAERGRVRYYHLALERLESGALELVVENLMTYLYAVRGENPTLQSADGLRRLELLTQSVAVRGWLHGAARRR